MKMKQALLFGLAIIVGMVFPKHLVKANQVLSDHDLVIFKSTSHPNITLELKGNTSFAFKENGTVSLSLQLKKKGVSQDRGATLYFYEIVGVPEFQMLSIADMRSLSMEERKKNFGQKSGIVVVVKGTDEVNNLFVEATLVSGTLPESSFKEKTILFPPDHVKKDLTSFFMKLDNDFKEETAGADDFFYGGLSFYTLEKKFISDKEGMVASVKNEYSSLAYTLEKEGVAQVLITLINYTHPSFSVENIQENPEHLVFVVSKNDTPIGFCELKKKDVTFTFRITELIDLSKLETSLKALWLQLETNPSALRGKFKPDNGKWKKYASTRTAFSSKEAYYFLDNQSYSVLNTYTFYSTAALIYLVKRMNITVFGRNKKIVTDNPSKYLEVHSLNKNYYALVVGEVDGEAVIQATVQH